MSPASKNSRAACGRGPDGRKSKNLRLRARMLAAVRGFFADHGYLEVETPCMAFAPIPEPHIDFVETSRGVLLPSPEVYMKRLLAEGHSRIFQIARCFRDGERGDRHLPEFTMLEWYRTGTDYRGLMEECEALVRSVAVSLGIGRVHTFQGQEIDLGAPWQRITVTEAFDRYAPDPLDAALASGKFEELLVIHVEPRLGAPVPTFLHDYPASMASLSKLRAGEPGVCERFELYLGGLEIANGFSELTDPDEQRVRFEGDVEVRKVLGRKPFPMPEAFLEAVGRMPDAAGMALGIDRLAMVLADCARIDHVVAFTPEDE